MLKSSLPVRVVLAAAAAATLGLSLAGPTNAAVIRNDVTASPPFHDGACPFTFTFTANIESDKGGIVEYRWFRSDGATGPVTKLDFRGPGTRTVTDTWQFNKRPPIKGWEAVRILSPNRGASNHAKFELTCG
jgi:hypothetical protein